MKKYKFNNKEKEIFNKEDIKIKKVPSEIKIENAKGKIKSNEDKEKHKESIDKKNTDNSNPINIRSTKEIRRDKIPSKRRSKNTLNLQH